MKIVIYHGKEFRVSEKCNFIATDKDGQITAFETRPEQDYRTECWLARKGYEQVLQYPVDETFSAWKKSCVRI